MSEEDASTSAGSSRGRPWYRLKGDESIKGRLANAWNSIKYNGRWLNDCAREYKSGGVAVLLGRFYPLSGETEEETFDRFFMDYHSRIWLTYRSAFPPLPDSSVTTDCGWGCMLRTGQMMLAHALVLIHLGRDWVWEPESCDGLEIIRLFEDVPSSPLSIHSLIQLSSDHPIGRWFTPSESIGLLRKALRLSSHDLTRNIGTVLSVDGRVVVSEMEEESLSWARNVLLFVCLRLGAHRINHCYFPHMKQLLQLPNCLGIVGGRPNHSLYFIGFDQNELIYLDPHVSHTYSPVSSDLHSFHCKLLSKLEMSSMDPSCAVGFLFQDKRAFFDTMKHLNLNQVIDMEEAEGQRRVCDPLFTVVPHPLPPPSPQLSPREVESARRHGFELM